MNRWITAALLVVIVALPFALRRATSTGAGQEQAVENVVVVSPHNEAIRREFGAVFEAWYFKTTGRTVHVDWRAIGGASEITRYLRGTYLGAFENYWKNTLGKRWSKAVADACMDDRVPRAGDTEASRARDAFLSSEVSCGIDVFFGGGSFEYEIEGRAGRLVEAGLLQQHPEWFSEASFPQKLNGETLRDPKGRWFGAALASFGILYNRDAVARLGLKEPTAWADLADARYFGQIALADPTKSGSMAKAFEMLLQQQMQRRLGALASEPLDQKEREARAVREGWQQGLRLIQRIGANARYFTDSAQQIPIDVSQGDCAAGMCIDFYGRYQEETVLRRSGVERIKYITPAGGSVYSADPIGLLRGAPNREVARRFLEFVVSVEGQKLWNFRVGEAGGPEAFSLRRLPVRRELYEMSEYRASRSDPGVNPYAETQPLIYRAEWTGALFREISFVVRAMCLDSHEELQAAWRAIAAAGFPQEAVKIFEQVQVVGYDEVAEKIRARRKTRLGEMELARELAEHFRRQYREAAVKAHSSTAKR